MLLESLFSLLSIILLAFLAGLLAHISYLHGRGDIAQLAEFDQLRHKLLQLQERETKIYQQFTKLQLQHTQLQTERDHFYKQIKENEHQINIAVQKTAMSRNVLHDLTHSVEAIINQLNELKEVRIEDAGQQKGVQAIRARLRHQINLVADDIRDMKRFIEEYGQDILVQRARCNFIKLCEEVRDSRNESAALHQIELTVAAPSGLPAVIVDKDYMRRVLTNLVDNSLKYANRQGAQKDNQKPYVRIELSLEQPKYDVMLIKVCDNGKGMQPELVAAFNHGAPLAEDQQKLHMLGSGLGLEIVKLYIKAHQKVGIDAEISVTSVVGKGSIFTIRLPLEHTE